MNRERYSVGLYISNISLAYNQKGVVLSLHHMNVHTLRGAVAWVYPAIEDVHDIYTIVTCEVFFMSISLQHCSIQYWSLDSHTHWINGKSELSSPFEFIMQVPR